MKLYFAKCHTVQAVCVTNGGHRPFFKHFHKIGVTNDLSRRLKQLQTGCPLAIQLVGAVEAGNRLQAITAEMAIHLHFKDRRTVGEWFSLTNYEQQAVDILISQWPVDDPVDFLARASAECKELVRLRRGVVTSESPDRALPAPLRVASTA